jgi:hypothetical protein
MDVSAGQRAGDAPGAPGVAAYLASKANPTPTPKAQTITADINRGRFIILPRIGMIGRGEPLMLKA